VNISKVNITSSVAGSALIGFVVFEDKAYTGNMSVRDKLLNPVSSAEIAKLIKAETRADVILGPIASKETSVRVQAGKTVATITWLRLTPWQIAGIVIGAFIFCFCSAVAYTQKQITCRGGPKQVNTPVVMTVSAYGPSIRV
jgi:hypothetical protein